MTQRFLILMLASTLFATVLASCDGAAKAPSQSSAPVATATRAALTATAPATFDRRAMLTAIVAKLILPAHTQLALEANALAAAIAQLAADPSMDALAAAQAQWQRTAAARATVEPFSLRFTMLVANAIKKWPINTSVLEESISGAEILDEAFIETSGSNAKGLGAIEYLLFSQTSTNAEIVDQLIAEPRRMAYLVALGENLAKMSAELLQMWSADGGNQALAFIQADMSGHEVQGSISMLANELIALTETIAKTKIDYPLRGVYAAAQPDSVEAPYAAYSIPLVVANLRSMQAILDVGLGSYLDFLQGGSPTPLSAAIDAQFERAIIALESIERPLRTAVTETPDAVRATRDEINALLVLLKVDMANQMGITVTFSDNDGD